jgi:hypothetical protein
VFEKEKENMQKEGARKLLKGAREQYAKNPKNIEEAEEYRKKYGMLTEKDMNMTFTI